MACSSTKKLCDLIKAGSGKPGSLNAGALAISIQGDIYTSNGTKVIDWLNADEIDLIYLKKVDAQNLKTDIVDSLNDTSTNKALSSNQGKVLNDKINSLSADDHLVSANFDNTTNTLTLTKKNGTKETVVIPDDKVLLINDLISTDTTKALTAAQGKVLKDLIDMINNDNKKSIIDGTFDNNTNILKLTKQDGSSIDIIIPDDKVAIIDSLTDTSTDKALSSNQGVEIKKLLDALEVNKADKFGDKDIVFKAKSPVIDDDVTTKKYVDDNLKNLKPIDTITGHKIASINNTDINETITTISFDKTTSVISFKDENGNTTNIDLSDMTNDKVLKSGIYNSTTKELELTIGYEKDTSVDSVIKIDISKILIEISSDPDNILEKRADGYYVRKDILTTLSFDNTTGVLSYKDEEGKTTNLNLSNVTVKDLLINGHKIGTISINNVDNVINETVTSLSFDETNNTLTFKDENGNNNILDLSKFVHDLKLKQASYNSTTKELELLVGNTKDATEDQTLKVPLSDLLPVQVDDETIKGDGTINNKLKVSISTDANNAIVQSVNDKGLLVEKRNDIRFLDASLDDEVVSEKGIRSALNEKVHAGYYNNHNYKSGESFLIIIPKSLEGSKDANFKPVKKGLNIGRYKVDSTSPATLDANEIGKIEFMNLFEQPLVTYFLSRTDMQTKPEFAVNNLDNPTAEEMKDCMVNMDIPAPAFLIYNRTDDKTKHPTHMTFVDEKFNATQISNITWYETWLKHVYNDFNEMYADIVTNGNPSGYKDGDVLRTLNSTIGHSAGYWYVDSTANAKVRFFWGSTNHLDGDLTFDYWEREDQLTPYFTDQYNYLRTYSFKTLADWAEKHELKLYRGTLNFITDLSTIKAPKNQTTYHVKEDNTRYTFFTTDLLSQEQKDNLLLQEDPDKSGKWIPSKVEYNDLSMFYGRWMDKPFDNPSLATFSEVIQMNGTNIVVPNAYEIGTKGILLKKGKRYKISAGIYFKQPNGTVIIRAGVYNPDGTPHNATIDLLKSTDPNNYENRGDSFEQVVHSLDTDLYFRIGRFYNSGSNGNTSGWLRIEQMPTKEVVDPNLVEVTDQYVDYLITDKDINNTKWSIQNLPIDLSTEGGFLRIESMTPTGNSMMGALDLNLPMAKGVEYKPDMSTDTGWGLRARYYDNNKLEISGGFSSSTSHTSVLYRIRHYKKQKSVIPLDVHSTIVKVSGISQKVYDRDVSIGVPSGSYGAAITTNVDLSAPEVDKIVVSLRDNPDSGWFWDIHINMNSLIKSGNMKYFLYTRYNTEFISVEFTDLATGLIKFRSTNATRSWTVKNVKVYKNVELNVIQ